MHILVCRKKNELINSFQCFLVQCIANERAKEVLNDVENLTEERIDEVITEFLMDLKEGMLETKG